MSIKFQSRGVTGAGGGALARAAVFAAIVTTGQGPGAMAAAQPVPSVTAWPELAGDPARGGTRPFNVAFGSARWTLSQVPSGEAITFIGPSAPVAAAGRLYLLGRVAGQARAICVDAEDGSVVWHVPVDSPVLDSWSSPAIDEESGVLLVPTGSMLTGLRLSDGAVVWQAPLASPMVNASPAVAGEPGRRRAFVTDYGGFGGTSNLYCVNLSTRHAVRNPHDPGEVLWSVPIGSATGSSPAVDSGTVVVATTGLDMAGIGELLAFDATATSPPVDRWRTANPEGHGFFGGVTLKQSPRGAMAYAASYGFSGGVLGSNLVKVRVDTGEVVWSIGCNRTSVAPVVLDDGPVLVSGGIFGFGTVPTIQCFADHGSSVSVLWDSALDTWVDLDVDLRLDAGEFLNVGAWTHQPMVLGAGSTRRVLTGVLQPGAPIAAPFGGLTALDLSRAPGDAGFATSIDTAAGGPCAVLGRGVYSVGAAGLRAFGSPPPRVDVNADGRVDIDDLYAWEQGTGTRDVDRSGVVDADDREMLIFELRRNERYEGRRR